LFEVIFGDLCSESTTAGFLSDRRLPFDLSCYEYSNYHTGPTIGTTIC